MIINNLLNKYYNNFIIIINMEMDMEVKIFNFM
jgi:hypothetical protein